MLRELRVRNLALLEDVRVPFGPGLNAVTGATGSGKSLLLASLDLLLGGRSSKEMLRTGVDELRVEGLFEVEDRALRRQLKELIGEDVDELLLRRRVDASGRNRCEAQGAMVPVATLREIGRLLVEIHGQSEHRALLESSEQTLLLDRAGDLVPQREAFAAQLRAWHDAKDALAALTTGHAQRAARLDALDAAAKEIRDARLVAGEQEELRKERTLLAEASRHVEALAAALALIDGGDTGDDGGDGATDRLGRASRTLEKTAHLDAEVKEAAAALEDAASRAADAARALRSASERIEANPARLEEVEDRLETIGRVLRRHGPSEQDALRALAEAESEAEALRSGDVSAEELTAKVVKLERELLAAGRALDAARRKAGAKLAKAVQVALAELGMEGTRFVVAIDEAAGDDAAARATSIGLSPVTFLVAPNAGEDPRPLAKIASGGELARIALALRGEIAGRDDVPLLVFDEIDADVGPRMGGVIGARLARLAKARQVIAVTHLPQVAEAASHHVVTAKHAEGARTVTSVDVVTGRERAKELEEMRGERGRTAPSRKLPGGARA